MSIIHTFLQPRMKNPINQSVVNELMGDRNAMEMLAAGVAEVCFISLSETGDMPKDMAAIIRGGPDNYNFGRLGIRPVTSPWAKQNYPDANYEIVITMVTLEGDRTHVIIAFLP